LFCLPFPESASQTQIELNGLAVHSILVFRRVNRLLRRERCDIFNGVGRRVESGEAMDGLSWVALRFAGGDAFFVGAALLAVAGLLQAWTWKYAGLGKRLLVLIAVVIVALSATPLSPVLYAVWGLAVLQVFLTRNARLRTGRGRALILAAPLVVASLAACRREPRRGGD
jgi:hypothetical protein